MHRENEVIRSLARSATLLLLLALTAVGTAEKAFAQFGVAAGANYDRFSDVELNQGTAVFDNATGYHVGIFYDLSVGPIGLRPGFFFADLGTFDVALENDGGADVRNVDLSLIDIPLDVRFRTTTPIVKPYALAGPVFRIASSSDEAFDEALSDMSMAGNVGVGLEVAVPGSGIRLFPELRYTFGIDAVVDDFTFLGSNVTAEEDQRLNTFMLRLGVTF